MPRRKTTLPPTETLTDLETHLAGTLKRVAPPRGFSQRLRERVRMPKRSLIADRIANWRYFFLVFSSVISGMLVAITLARAFFHLFGRRSG